MSDAQQAKADALAARLRREKYTPGILDALTEIIRIGDEWAGAPSGEKAMGGWLSATETEAEHAASGAAWRARRAYERLRNASAEDAVVEAAEVEHARIEHFRLMQDRDRKLAFLLEADEQLRELFGGPARWVVYGDNTIHAWHTLTGPPAIPPRPPDLDAGIPGRRTLAAAYEPPVEHLSIEAVHARWVDADKAGRKSKHPLAPIVREWMQQHRLTGRAVALTAVARNSMPRMRIEVADRAQSDDLLLIGAAPAPPERQLALFPRVRSDVAAPLPVWFLDLWAAAQIATRAAKGTVPFGIRFRDQLLLRVEPNWWDGFSHDLDPAPTLAEVGRMLVPDGSRPWHKDIKNRWPGVRESLMLAGRRVPVFFPNAGGNGVGNTYDWPLLTLTLPHKWDPAVPVGVTFRIPQGAVMGGMRVNAERLRALGMRSLLYRVYLVCRYLADRNANKGRDKTRTLAGGKPNTFIVRGAVGDIPRGKLAPQYVRPVPWDVMLRTVFGKVSTRPRRDQPKVVEALNDLRSGAGLHPGGRDAAGIDFEIVRGGIQVFGDPKGNRRPPSGSQ